MKNFFKKLYLRLTEFSWKTGVMDYDEDFIFNPEKKPSVRWVKSNRKSSWFADPFIISRDADTIDMLVEEYEYSRHKGRISRIKVDAGSMKLISVTPVLDGPVHFSFPNWFFKDGKIFICPENVHSGKLNLYEYNPESGICSFVKVLNNNPLADATFYNLNGRDVILATRYPYDNSSRLEIYPVFDGECPVVLEPIDTIVFDDNSARNAGRIFHIGDKTIRPAQNSNHFYGEALVFQEMKEIEGKLDFKEIRRVASPCRKYPLSFHTFNVFDGGIAAVDVQGFRYGWFGLILYRIREHFRR